MKIAVMGATGMAGSRIAAEAARRGHRVSGFSRSRCPIAEQLVGVTLASADATDVEAMARIAEANEVIVLATRPATGGESDVGAVVSRVLDSGLASGRRVIVIGGAGPLRSPDSPSRLVIDDSRFVSNRWRASAQASIDQLAACAAHGANWTYLSPPALFEPGTRTGRYRRGGTELLVDAHGVSRISAEDLALAVVDEIELPHDGGRHFTVAY
ncbi:NAD(P)-dependent oxidoreductase [Glaciibacter superstes]|uniref:NAD(P)-dependent oxidoreductase n=1 Tax=Glaciibacter superstes TaxID=501023 RepID=UPI0003B75759|nr:NAD(P)H-binding protein [Glaciibacter superstes]